MAAEEHRRSDVHKKIRVFLNNSGSYVDLSINSFSLKENIEKRTSAISCDLYVGCEKIKIRGQGVG